MMMVFISCLILWGASHLRSEVTSSISTEYGNFYDKQTKKEYLSEGEFEQLIAKQKEYHESTQQQGGASLSLMSVNVVMILMLVANFIVFKGAHLNKPIIVSYLAFSVVATAIIISIMASIALGAFLAVVVLITVRKKRLRT